MKNRHLQLPLSEKEVRDLRVGDTVLLTGKILTARDMAQRWILEERPDILRKDLLEGALYHCGPIMLFRDGKWFCSSAGPTSSTRQEPYQAGIIKEYGLRCVIGKGGMGERTAQAMRDHGSVYLHAIGGAAVLYANTVRSVESVLKLEEFGMPEAVWTLIVADFPAVVSMDAHGNSLHREIEDKSRELFQSLLLPKK